MIIDNIVGSINRGMDMNLTSSKKLFDLLASDEYKDFLVPDYFPEIQYMENDDVIFMKSGMYCRKDVTPVFYYFISFDKDGHHQEEVTPGYIELRRDSNLLHISATKSKTNDYGIVKTTYSGISIIGAYSMESDKYSVASEENMIRTQAEYDDDGAVIVQDSGKMDKLFYVPATDTASGVVKSCMYKVMDDLNAGKIRLPELY